MKFSGWLTGYFAWTLAVALWMSTAFGLGWRMPSMGGGGVGTGSTRSGGGYFPHSSWSFGK